MEIALHFENACTPVYEQSIDTAVYGVLAVMSEPLLARCKAWKWLIAVHKYSLPPGEEIGPTDFERCGGRAQSKKWKESVKLFVDGSPGLAIGRWLAQQAPAQVHSLLLSCRGS